MPLDEGVHASFLLKLAKHLGCECETVHLIAYQAAQVAWVSPLGRLKGGMRLVTGVMFLLFWIETAPVCERERQRLVACIKHAVQRSPRPWPRQTTSTNRTAACGVCLDIPPLRMDCHQINSGREKAIAIKQMSW